MNESNREQNYTEIEPAETLEYICGVAREILLKAPKEGKFCLFWYNERENSHYKLSAINLMGSDDPTFSLQSKPVATPGELKRSEFLYTFNKRHGITSESPIGTQLTQRHNSDEDPIVHKVLGLIIPQLHDSEVMRGKEAREMRKAFYKIAGRIAIEHLYTLTERPLVRTSIDQLVDGIEDPTLSKKTKQFVVDARKWYYTQRI